MLNPQRIEEYNFSAGSLVADANGRINTFSDYSVNGEIRKVNYLIGNYDANGSLFLFISGTNELLWSLVGGLDTSSIMFPFVYGTDRNGNSGSPFIFVKRVANSPLRFVGSGLGAGTSGNLSLFYS